MTAAAGLSGSAVQRSAELTDGAQAVRRRARPIWALVVFGFIALALVIGLFSLGDWQLQRREWKLDLIDRVERRLHAAPVAAPGPAAWATINAADDEYRRVSIEGRWLNDRETFVQATTSLGGGYWVLTPFETVAGFTVLVNRGFVPPEMREPAKRLSGQISGPTRVAGLMRMTEPGGGFLRENDAAADRWYSRDIAAIADRRLLSAVAPYFIDADGTPNPGGYPVGGLTVVRFHNSHLVYAVTWFALGALLIGGVAIVARTEWRLRRAIGAPNAEAATRTAGA